MDASEKRFFSFINGGNAKGESSLIYIAEATAGHDIYKIFSFGKSHYRIGKIGIGIAVSGNHFAEQRKDMGKIETVELFDGERLWPRKFKDEGMTTRGKHPVHFRKSFLQVLKITDAKGNHHQVEGMVGKRDAFGIGKQQFNSSVQSFAVKLLLANAEHSRRDVDAGNFIGTKF